MFVLINVLHTSFSAHARVHTAHVSNWKLRPEGLQIIQSRLQGADLCFYNRNCIRNPKMDSEQSIGFAKGQLSLKADWCAIDSPKKQTDEFVLFPFLLFTANKSNSSVRFLGESTAHQSAFQLYLTFTGPHS